MSQVRLRRAVPLRLFHRRWLRGGVLAARAAAMRKGGNRGRLIFRLERRKMNRPRLPPGMNSLEPGEELIGACYRRNDLLVGSSVLHGVHEAAQAAAVGRAPKEILVEALDQVLLELLAAEYEGGHLAPRGPSRQGCGETRQPACVGSP